MGVSRIRRRPEDVRRGLPSVRQRGGRAAVRHLSGMIFRIGKSPKVFP